jgi:anaerobic selenocysteine-containing dehydrogenase
MLGDELKTKREDIKWVKTHCSRMDHGGCGLLVGVKNNRVVKVKGDPKGLLNKGYICTKAIAAPDILTHPGRLRYPLKRVGTRGHGKWKRITWSEALESIRENFLKIKGLHGARAVAFCLGMPKGTEHFALIRLANVFGSPNVVGTQDVCHMPREISGKYTCGFYPVADFGNKTGLALLWGSNITETNEEGEICSRLLGQIKRGTELIIVDPRKTALVHKSKYWLQIRPGTDNALALAFLNVIIEEGLYDRDFAEKWCYGFDRFSDHIKQYSPEKMSDITWVPAQLIRKAARHYAGTHPAAIQWGNPVEQNINTFDTSRALVCLMALCGNLDVQGGNIHATEPAVQRLGKLVKADLLPSKREEMIHAYHNTLPGLMNVPPAHFRRAVIEDIPYPVRGAYMQGTNPLLAYAESGMTLKALLKLDFLVVTELFMTPTASFADIVLPAATTFEFNDIGHVGLGHGYILARPKAVDPPEECWPDIKIINELGKSLTSKEYWYEDYNDFLNEILGPTGLDFKQLSGRGYLRGPQQYRKYEQNGFRTPTGKVELCLSKASDFNIPPMPVFTTFPEDDDPAYPLVLTSRKSRYYLHSSYRWVSRLREHELHPRTELHPQTAERYGFGEGDEIIIKTRMGEITQIAHLTDKVHPGVICSAYGWWFPEAEAGTQYNWERSNFNMLTSAEKLGKEFGTPNLKGIGCIVRKKQVKMT